MGVRSFIMNIKIAAILFMSATASAAAEKEISIVTPFEPATSRAAITHEYVKLLNETQDVFNFRLMSVPGADGESAYKRVVTQSKLTKDVILQTNQAKFTDFERGRENNFNFLSTLSASVKALVVSKESNITTFKQFIDYSKTKDIIYRGNQINDATGNKLNNILVDNFNLQVKSIAYKGPNDTLRALLIKEIDYAILNSNNVNGNINQLVVASNTSIPGLEHIPTARDVGMTKFNYVAYDVFSIPKDNQELYNATYNLFRDTCTSKELKDRLSKISSDTNIVCMGSAGILATIRNDIEIFGN
jgi:tripartite-type tricarboxylate transporter receptor subunit TctC